ncbi:MAG TPA: F420-dependent NADP oxidoreductase [Planctomycetaceae bacterium]|nr:F420-dependent NADP oxidoreductase [Planctomycetaceae bacterium]
MKIAIIGSGNVGSVLGRRLAETGHSICFASRTPDSPKIASLIATAPDQCTAAFVGDAIANADVVIYAAPYDQAESILSSVADFHGSVLIDCTNPLNATFDGLQLGHTESAGERLALWAPTARVVKAFNTTSVATMANPQYDGHIATQFYCGDDTAAKQTVADLITQLAMEPVDAGPLRNARYLEATAMLYIHLAIRGGWGGNCALKMLKR